MVSEKPTSEELHDVSLAAQKLWDLDENRLANVKDYDINVGVRRWDRDRVVGCESCEG